MGIEIRFEGAKIYFEMFLLESTIIYYALNFEIQSLAFYCLFDRRFSITVSYVSKSYKVAEKDKRVDMHNLTYRSLVIQF